VKYAVGNLMADNYFVFGSISYMEVPVTLVSAFHNLIPTPTQSIAYLRLEIMLSHYSTSVTSKLDEISKCVFIIKPTRCTNFTNLFWHGTLHVSDSSSVHHQEFIHRTLSDGTAFPSWSCSKAVYKPVWHIPLLSVQWINSWWWTDELSKTRTVSRQNKLVKLVDLVGSIKQAKTHQGL